MEWWFSDLRTNDMNSVANCYSQEIKSIYHFKSIFVFPGKLEYVNIPPTPIRPHYYQSKTKRKRK